MVTFMYVKTQTILCGLGLLAIASVPYSSTIIKPAYASNGVHKIAICSANGSSCATVAKYGQFNILMTK